MKERVEALVGPRARLMWVSTFHSACVRILRKEIDKLGFRSSFTIYDAADSKRLMTMVIKDLDLDPRRYQPGAVLHWVSTHKNELRGPEEVAADTHNKFEEAYAAAYTRYQQRLRDANALDFDDILTMSPSTCSRRSPRCARPTGAGSGTCSSTSTRTPTTRSTP